MRRIPKTGIIAGTLAAFLFSYAIQGDLMVAWVSAAFGFICALAVVWLIRREL